MLASLLGRSDKAIVRRVLRGQREDFGVLVERYYGAVHAVVNSRVSVHADAEDIAQDAFLRAFMKLDTLQDPARFGPWLTTIARNAALNWVTRRKESVTLDTMPESVAGSEEPAMERREREQLVRAHLDRLDDGPREILYLHYFSGKSLREIAELTNISREAAAKRLQRAREALGEELLQALSGDETGTPKDHTRQYKAIMAAVVGASVAWRASAGSGGLFGGLLAGAGAKVGLAIFIVSLTLGSSWVGLQLRDAVQTDAPIRMASALPAAPAAETVAAVPAAEAPPAEESAQPTGGPGKITVQCVTVNDEPVEGAAVSVELVDWEAHEFPPEETYLRHAVSDAFGRAVFEGLPLGTYHDLALADGRVGINDSFLSENRLEDASRRVLMLPAKSLRGRIVTPEGDPVAGAVLYPVIHKMFPDREIAHTEMAGLRRITNDAGVFRYDNMMKGDVRFYVLTQDGQQMFTDYISIPSINAKIVMGRPAGVQLAAVHAGTGEAIPNLSLEIWRGSRLRYTATTDADGNCAWPTVAPGYYQVRIDDPVLVPDKTSSVIHVPESELMLEKRLQFLQGGTIVGRVALLESGEGVAGARVYCYDMPTMHKMERAENISGPDGSFVITGLGEGTVNLSTGGDVEGYVFSQDQVSVAVTPGEESSGAVLRAMKCAPVSGRVYGPDGGTISGAKVIASAYLSGEDAGNFYGSQRVVSSLDGRYSLRQLPGGTEMSIRAEKDGQRSATQTVSLPTEGRYDLDLELTRASTGIIEGYALNASRTPIGRGDVYATLVGSGQISALPGIQDIAAGSTGLANMEQSFSAHASTDAIGYFKLEGLPPGEYRLTPSSFRPGNQIACEGTAIILGDGQHLQDAEVFCHPPGDLRITGRVLRPDGGSVMYALIQQIPDGNQHATENEGYFELVGLNPGVHTIQFATHEYSPVVMQIEAGTQNVVVQLEHHASLEGIVLDAETGEPVPQFTVRYRQPGIAAEDAREPPEGILSVDNQHGAFGFATLAAGEISLQVSADGYPSQETVVEYLAGGVENEVTLYLEAAREQAIPSDVPDLQEIPAGQHVIQREDGTMVVVADEVIAD